MRDMWTVTLIQSESVPSALYLDRIADFSTDNEINVNPCYHSGYFVAIMALSTQ